MYDGQGQDAGKEIADVRQSPLLDLVSNAFAGLAAISIFVTIIVESNSWFPFEFWGFPGLYWIAVLVSLVTGTVALTRKPWRGLRSWGGILVWLFVLTPFFLAAMLLILLNLRS